MGFPSCHCNFSNLSFKLNLSALLTRLTAAVSQIIISHLCSTVDVANAVLFLAFATDVAVDDVGDFVVTIVYNLTAYHSDQI